MTCPRCSRLPIRSAPRLRLGIARRYVLSAMLLPILWASPARSHDPGAWGGLFRSRDQGATWVSENSGPFTSGVIALAISPTDVDHLLLAADSGLLRSRNGGRNWTVEAPTVVAGPIFGLAFSADGQDALIATGRGIFRGGPGTGWRQVPAPKGATPARAIVRGGAAGCFYLAGSTGLFRSDDQGASWSRIAGGLPREAATALLVLPKPPETLYAIVRGAIWASADGGRSWASRAAGISPGAVDALATDLTHPTRLWAAGGDRLFRSDDGGMSWQGVGRPLPEPNTSVRGIAAGDEAIVIATDRGLYRTIDDGEHWAPVTGNLPAHLEAGLLARDPVDPATLYAGFSLIPYPELWRRAANREGALAQVTLTSVAGGVGLFVAVALVAFFAASARTPLSAGREERVGHADVPRSPD
jgi:photosystem II stability/assembly factor-like uncharacterized protein